MSCPTCDHTMQGLLPPIEAEEKQLWLCPRCGTVKAETSNGDVEVIVPKLVERCRKYSKLLGEDTQCGHLLDVLELYGIAEAINTPENRS